MRVLLKQAALTLVPEDDAERADLDAFGERHAGRVLRCGHAGEGIQLFDIGPEDVVRNKPINITSRAPAPLNVIANFAPTPFDIDGRAYASVEGFWQSLKFPDPAERARVAALSGSEAKRAAADAPPLDTFEYDGL